MAGVLATAITAWMVAWGLIPDQAQRPDTAASRLSGQVDPWKQFSDLYQGAPAVHLHVEITVQGKTGAQVVIHDLRVRVVRRSEPLPGTFVTQIGGGAEIYR